MNFFGGSSRGDAKRRSRRNSPRSSRPADLNPVPRRPRPETTRSSDSPRPSRSPRPVRPSSDRPRGGQDGKPVVSLSGQAASRSGQTLADLRARREASRRPERPHPVFSPPQNPIQLPQPRTKKGWSVLYGVRLLILGLGLGVLAGTAFSIWDPASRLSAGASSAPKPAQEIEEVLPLTQELTPLKTQIQALLTAQPKLVPSIMLVDLDSHNYVDIGAEAAFPGASTLKFPLLVAFFQDVDQGQIQLNEVLTMRKELVAQEAGDMQDQPVNSKFSALKTVSQMITISDNTATNMIIDRLGGMAKLNERFKQWGLTQTVLLNLLPDIQGTNTTSAKDLVTLMAMINDGKLVSLKSRDRILDIMRTTENRSLLPQGLGEGATIAHKTGTLGTLIGDIGLIDTPNGKRYIAGVLLKRPRDDEKAEETIQQISRLAYQQINQQAAAPQPTPTLSPDTQPINPKASP